MRFQLISDYFAINRVTGDVFYTKSFERYSTEVITIKVTDGKFNADMTLNVRFVSDDEEDNPHRPVFNQSSYYLSLPSTKINTTKVIFQFSAFDLDNNLLVYVLNETCYHFKIDSFSGELFMVKTLDTSTYSIVITVYDSVITTIGTKSSSVTVLISTPNTEITHTTLTNTVNTVTLITTQSLQTVLIASIVSSLVVLIITVSIIVAVFYYYLKKLKYKFNKYNEEVKN